MFPGKLEYYSHIFLLFFVILLNSDKRRDQWQQRNYRERQAYFKNTMQNIFYCS